MGTKGVRFDEFDDRVAEYWQPTDFDPAAVAVKAQDSAARFNNDGWLELQFDDPTLVLTEVAHRLSNGRRVLYRTAETPQAVLAAHGQAAPAQGGGGGAMPASWQEMWTTYKGWAEYQQYAASRYIDENTNFLNDVAAYRAAPSDQALRAIKAQYIGDAAATPINISGEIGAAIEARDDAGADVFDAAETDVIGPLQADFANFTKWWAANIG